MFYRNFPSKKGTIWTCGVRQTSLEVYFEVCFFLIVPASITMAKNLQYKCS